MSSDVERPWTVSFDPPLVARHVRVRRLGAAGPLHLRRVRILGRVLDRPVLDLPVPDRLLSDCFLPDHLLPDPSTLDCHEPVWSGAGARELA